MYSFYVVNDQGYFKTTLQQLSLQKQQQNSKSKHDCRSLDMYDCAGISQGSLLTEQK